MLKFLWLVPAIPFGSALILATRRWSPKATAVLGTAAIAASSAISLVIASEFLKNPSRNAFTQVLWTWIDVAGFRPEIALYLDALSLVMVAVVTFVAFLIHLYSIEFMADDDGYRRFFAYMNLFVASMVTLILADNLLLVYLGWEGVGLCSYLLIGFWYRDPVNGLAARKAFIVTRIGDTAMAIGLFLLFTNLGTLRIQDLMQRASMQWLPGSGPAIAAAALLLGGAVGKSAQLPLQTWLPDAMAGPTPTSALIHAATMVTAGVYLIARMHILFQLAPQVQFIVAIIGAATLLLSGFSALVQRDIKRVLAYSTMSQIGYMFVALGVGAWTAAIFHFMTHAFFKALLFLAAGIVINALHHEHDMFRMGGLRRELPVAFWTFLVGGCALAGLPLVTSGAYSKDLILWDELSSPSGASGLWAASIAGVFLTSLYTFRLIFLVFFGRPSTDVTRRPGFAMQLPVWILTALSIAAGFPQRSIIDFLATALPGIPDTARGVLSETGSAIVASLTFASGLLLAVILYLRPPIRQPSTSAVQRFWLAGWGFDWVYDRLLVRPVVWVSNINKNDIMDSFYDGIAKVTELAYRAMSHFQTGKIRWYAAGIAAGSALFIAIAIFR